MASSASLTKPARRQVAPEKVLGPQAAAPPRPGQTYNIYYDKWSGGDRSDRSGGSKEKASHRCDPVKDSGRTKGTFNPNAYFCAFFAKGCCPKGEECGWLHRIPTRQDQVDSGMDVFGRERFNDHRDDRGGVGSMQSDSRTLYVGRIHQDPNMQSAVEKHFKLWGEVERIKILNDKGVAFVTYQSRLNAEFAKEAMANQSLNHGEIINIRWATEDPNPKAQATNKRKAVEMTKQAIESRLPDSVKETNHLPGLEESLNRNGAYAEKRSKIPGVSDATEPSAAPTPYLGQDGHYYYDFGTYGYNYETQQYDPARLHQQQHQPQEILVPVTKATAAPSIQDRVNAALSAVATGLKTEAERPKVSALSALAAYGSDSESEDEE